MEGDHLIRIDNLGAFIGEVPVVSWEFRYLQRIKLAQVLRPVDPRTRKEP